MPDPSFQRRVLVRSLRHARDLVAERPGARIFRVDTSSWRDAFEGQAHAIRATVQPDRPALCRCDSSATTGIMLQNGPDTLVVFVVLGAAFMHATWNALVRTGSSPFITWPSSASPVLPRYCAADVLRRPRCRRFARG
ncbi:MAG: hypothetical protein R3D03_13455 [Geminicoccaceae bacterium]